MKYRLQFLAPYEKWIDLQLSVLVEAGTHHFCLPHWRPGRYELQNYPRHIADVWATSSTGEPVSMIKTASHQWEVQVAVETELTINYRYYADQTDAGGSYIDHTGIYVNGINLFMYRAGKEAEPCELILDLPESFQIAGGLPGDGPSYALESFHQLVDTPFFAGEDLIHHQFQLEGIPTHLWFKGFCRPDFNQIERDFMAYSKAQLQLFGDFPVKEYHYLFVILPTHFRHGVEHHNSTVIAMGPGYRLMESDFYKSFLEISSHELFHTWNVKALRPQDMYPYDYSQENYSRLHYITEGVTTYYGDLMIWKGKTWTLDQWIASINGELNTHHRLGGHPFISLEEASFDSWVNGYKKNSAPNRKISFYTKGYLVAMLLDVEIRRATENVHSLDDVIHQMYQRIAKAGRGYTAEDYQGIAEDFSGKNLDSFFNAYVSGTESLHGALAEMGAYFGLSLVFMESRSLAESKWGMKLQADPTTGTTIAKLLPGSPALASGMTYGDELISIGGRKVEGNADELFTYFSGESELPVFFFHEKELHQTVLRSGNFSWKIPQFVIRGDRSQAQVHNLVEWQKVGGANKEKQISHLSQS